MLAGIIAFEFQSRHARDENRQQEGIQRPPLLEAVVIAVSDGILGSKPFVDRTLLHAGSDRADLRERFD